MEKLKKWSRESIINVINKEFPKIDLYTTKDGSIFGDSLGRDTFELFEDYMLDFNSSEKFEYNVEYTKSELIDFLRNI